MTRTQGTNHRTIDGETFEAFRAAHPEVEEVLADWALAEWSDGVTYLSMTELWAAYRTRCGPGGGRVPFGMNDQYKAFMVRLLVTDYPELRSMFLILPALEADAWWRGYMRRRADPADVPRPRDDDDR